jgi:hypothetical protein
MTKAWEKIGIVIASLTLATTVALPETRCLLGLSSESCHQDSPESLMVSEISPEQFVKHHYALLNNRKYETAWTELSDNYKFYCSNLGYQKYIDYWKKFSVVSVENLKTIEQDTNKPVVEYMLRLKYDQSNEYKELASRILLAKLNDTSEWQIDAISNNYLKCIEEYP